MSKRKSASSLGRMKRNKGARGELEVVKLLKVAYPNARRRCTGEESQGRRGRDLDGLDGDVPLCAQVSLSGAPAIERKYREAAKAAAPSASCLGAHDGEIAVAFTRRTPGGKWLATLSAEELVYLLVEVRLQREGREAAETRVMA